MGQTLDHLLPIAAAVIATATGNPELAPFAAAAVSGGQNYSQTHNFGSALKSGALSGAGTFVGANIGNALLPNLGTVGGDLFGTTGAASSDIGSSFMGPSNLPWQNIPGYALPSAGSSSIADALGSGVGGAVNSALNMPVNTALGAYAGNSLATSYAPQPTPPGTPQFSPGGVPVGAMLGSLNSMASLTPQQQSSSLATQGAYGGGLGPQEQGYFSNLVQNQLNPIRGQTNDLSSLNPIENNYLGQLGFGGYGNHGSPNSLLKALSQWNPSA